MALRPPYSSNDLCETLKIPNEYPSADAYDVPIVSFDPQHILELTRQITMDIEQMDVFADKYEEAALMARRKSRHMQSVLRSLQNSAAPIFRLPTELLAVIFERCVECDAAGHVFSEHSMPWVLAQTCRRWRSVAVSTPSLWTVVRLDSRDAHALRSNRLHMLRIWLERSQSLPISCLAGLEESAEVAHALTILEILLSHSSRWSNIDFGFGSHAELYYKMAYSDLQMPCLMTLRIDVSFPATTRPSGPNGSWMARNLREATLILQDLENDDSILGLHWPFRLSLPQLSELSWAPYTDKHFLDISHTFTQLRYCCLNLTRYGGFDGLPTCTLHQLHHLDLYGPFRSIISIIDRITLPALEDLVLDFVEQISPVADHILSALGRLRDRSSCSLHYLSTPLPLLNPHNSPVSLDKNGSTRELSIIVSKEERHEKAISNLSSLRTFRALETLHVTFRELPDGQSSLFSSIVNMVEARFSPNSSNPTKTPFRTLSIEMIDYSLETSQHIPLHHEAFQRLLRLQKRGLILLGHVVDDMWRSTYRDTHWNTGDMTRAERRWYRFGRSDWLYHTDFEDYRR
ncbi:hypothetical protein V5O48_012306 [Marasmius crinis-equi]|uniref:F-box domain-containing protein n=1 Tax=Marasmius crinis-equi TaxID=585013 RepID=A0ABR3F3M5_9AGAR